MAFCNNCGAKINEETGNCPNCGTPVDALQGGTASGADNLMSKVKEFNNMADTTAQYDKQDIDNNLLMGILAYVSILVLVPIFMAPNSKYARFHANQGLILFIAEIVLILIGSILRFSVVGFICGIFWLIIAVFCVIGIVNVVQGKAKELPVIGFLKILK